MNADDAPGPNPVQTVANAKINPLFEATVEATEEAIVNALVAAKTMTGMDGHAVFALPHEELRRVLRKFHGRGERIETGPGAVLQPLRSR